MKVDRNIVEPLKRSKNFKLSEIDVLLNLVNENKNVIECKKTDQISVKQKDTAWQLIENAFNQKSGIYHRDWKTLKQKYENLKKTAKRKWVNEKNTLSGTSESLNEPLVLDSRDIRIKDILGDIQVCGNDTQFHSDICIATVNESGTGNIEVVSCVDEISVVSEESVLCNMNEQDPPAAGENSMESITLPVTVTEMKNEKLGKSPGQKLGKCIKFGSTSCVKDLKIATSSNRPTRHSLYTRKRKSHYTVINKKIEKFFKAKHEVLALKRTIYLNQIENQRTEHELRMKFMKEEHEQNMKSIKLKVLNEDLSLKLKQKLRDYGIS